MNNSYNETINYFINAAIMKTIKIINICCSILGYKNAVKYAQKLKNNIFKKLKKYDNRSSDLKDTVEFILKRKK